MRLTLRRVAMVARAPQVHNLRIGNLLWAEYKIGTRAANYAKATE